MKRQNKLELELDASADPSNPTDDNREERVGLKSDGTTGQTTGHLAARGAASRYMARRKATRQVTERYRPTTCYTVTLQYIYWWTNLNFKLKT